MFIPKYCIVFMFLVFLSLHGAQAACAGGHTILSPGGNQTIEFTLGKTTFYGCADVTSGQDIVLINTFLTRYRPTLKLYIGFEPFPDAVNSRWQGIDSFQLTTSEQLFTGTKSFYLAIEPEYVPTAGMEISLQSMISIPLKLGDNDIITSKRAFFHFPHCAGNKLNVTIDYVQGGDNGKLYLGKVGHPTPVSAIQTWELQKMSEEVDAKPGYYYFTVDPVQGKKTLRILLDSNNLQILGPNEPKKVEMFAGCSVYYKSFLQETAPFSLVFPESNVPLRLYLSYDVENQYPDEHNFDETQLIYGGSAINPLILPEDTLVVWYSVFAANLAVPTPPKFSILFSKELTEVTSNKMQTITVPKISEGANHYDYYTSSVFRHGDIATHKVAVNLYDSGVIDADTVEVYGSFQEKYPLVDKNTPGVRHGAGFLIMSFPMSFTGTRLFWSLRTPVTPKQTEQNLVYASVAPLFDLSEHKSITTTIEDNEWLYFTVDLRSINVEGDYVLSLDVDEFSYGVDVVVSTTYPLPNKIRGFYDYHLTTNEDKRIVFRKDDIKDKKFLNIGVFGIGTSKFTVDFHRNDLTILQAHRVQRGNVAVAGFDYYRYTVIEQGAPIVINIESKDVLNGYITTTPPAKDAIPDNYAYKFTSPARAIYIDDENEVFQDVGQYYYITIENPPSNSDSFNAVQRSSYNLYFDEIDPLTDGLYLRSVLTQRDGFDIYSYHTAETKRQFLELTPLAEKNGPMSLYVQYGDVPTEDNFAFKLPHYSTVHPTYLHVPQPAGGEKTSVYASVIGEGAANEYTIRLLETNLLFDDAKKTAIKGLGNQHIYFTVENIKNLHMKVQTSEAVKAIAISQYDPHPSSTSERSHLCFDSFQCELDVNPLNRVFVAVELYDAWTNEDLSVWIAPKPVKKDKGGNGWLWFLFFVAIAVAIGFMWYKKKLPFNNMKDVPGIVKGWFKRDATEAGRGAAAATTSSINGYDEI
ncbi:hypothetical protein PCE1_000060 [Barthelona sp. PCE]